VNLAFNLKWLNLEDFLQDYRYLKDGETQSSNFSFTSF